MKIIIQDIQETSIEIENPEISIKDKNHPDQIYVFSPTGGYIMFTADYRYRFFRVEANMTSEIISIEMNGEK